MGKDGGATRFLSSLDTDPAIGSMIDCTSYYEQEQEEYARKVSFDSPQACNCSPVCYDRANPDSHPTSLCRASTWTRRCIWSSSWWEGSIAAMMREMRAKAVFLSLFLFYKD